MLASHYDDVEVDRLFEGTKQLSKALQSLVEAAEQTLDLEERTLLRLDAGDGSLDDVNWLLV